MYIGEHLNRKKVQVGNDQEKAQSERNSNSKNQGGKNFGNLEIGIYTKKTYPSEQLIQ